MIQFQGKAYEHQPGETVLTCLERHGVRVPSFCRSGVCQSCLLRVTEGSPPARAQQGLKDSWRRQGLVLSCVCEITEPLNLEPADVAKTYESRVRGVERLSANILRVRVDKPDGFSFEGGQFVQLARASDQLSRPYSIASLPSDEQLEFHVAVYPEGALSPWFSDATGQAVLVTGPFGECTYFPGEPERPLLLAGTGTGLAPLVAVLRAAVAAKHAGPIALYHGARSPEELYYWAQLRALCVSANVSVCGVTLESAAAGDPSILQGDLVQTVLAKHSKPNENRIYLCGNPDLVQTLKKRLYLAGATLSRIHSDPFLPKAVAS